jgi:signal transduction histidine kinase
MPDNPSAKTATRSRFSRAVIILMGAGTLILIVIVGASVWLAASTANLGAEVLQARKTRTAASEALEMLLSAETSQRGYILTLNGRYLQPYLAAMPVLKRDLATLNALERGDPVSGPLVTRLNGVAEAKMAIIAQTIALVQAGHRDQAVSMVRTGSGLNLMDNARRILRTLVGNAETVVASDIDRLNANARLLQWITTIGGILVVAFGVSAMWLVYRAIRQAVRARQEVENLNLSLEDRVLRRTAALTRANEEIQRFAYIVSHDLRAPLVNIMGFTSELEVGTKSLKEYFEDGAPEAQAQARETALVGLPEAVKFIRSSTGKMDRLINAILKLSREGKRELASQNVSLASTFAAIADSLRHQIDETSTTVDISPDLPTIRSDRLALEQVFSNLLDNALKYLQPGRPGRIVVSSRNDPNSVTISVKDNGRGIAENDQERVFELFRRAGRQDRPGEGIGLAHVRALVRRLGGDITVISKLGEGSEFRVLLPRSLSSDTGHTAA